jgi:hypothetical protein
MSQLVVGSRNIWILESFRPFEMVACAGFFYRNPALAGQRIRKVRDDRIKVEGLSAMAAYRWFLSEAYLLTQPIVAFFADS